MATNPLEVIDETLLVDLGQTLWGWDKCTGHDGKEICASRLCPSYRLDQLLRYFQFYKALILTYVDDTPPASRLFKKHEDILQSIRHLKGNPDISRVEFCRVLADASTHKSASPADVIDASTLVVKVFIMIDCSALHHSSNRLETGTFRVHWKEDVPFSKYLQDLFPTHRHPILSFVDNDLFLDMTAELRATNLKKRLGITFRATHDIRNHLRLDRGHNVLEIYHHTAFIKEQLRATKDAVDLSTPTKCIQAGALPRQLLLETLDSLQVVLFPLSEPKSRRFLRSLVKECSLDPDIENFEFSSIRSAGEESIPYVMLADRLSELYNELQSPRPRGWFGKRMERKSGARYMMMATLGGVIFAVLLGICALAVSCYQTWIAYQAWQHPVAPPSA